MTTSNTLDTGSEQVLVSGLARNKFQQRRPAAVRAGRQAVRRHRRRAAEREQPANRTLKRQVLRITRTAASADNPVQQLRLELRAPPVRAAFDSQGRLWEQEFGDSHQDETKPHPARRQLRLGRTAKGTSAQRCGCGQSGFIAPKRTYPVADARAAA